MAINAGVDFLPSDTQASIYTSGLLGEQYISLEPGAEDDVLSGELRNVDFNKKDSCVDCDNDNWDECADTNKEIEKENQKESKSSKRRNR